MFAKPQRKYRERAQPTHREHLGLLEKHKDYKKRATNYQTKQKQLQRLHLKAALKNKDEFNFKMIKGQQKDGQHIQYVEEPTDQDEGILLNQIKSQNQNLLKAAITQKEKLSEKLKEELGLVNLSEGQHKFFTKINRKKSMESVEEKLQQEDAQAQPSQQISQKLHKLQETLYEKERLKRFYVAVTKSKIRDNQQPHQKKKIKKHKQKGLIERAK